MIKYHIYNSDTPVLTKQEVNEVISDFIIVNKDLFEEREDSLKLLETLNICFEQVFNTKAGEERSFILSSLDLKDEIDFINQS